MYVLALSFTVDEKIVDKALVLAISVEDVSKLDDVMKVQGVKEAAKGKMGELVALFTDSDELEAVARGQKWLDTDASWCEGFSEFDFRELQMVIDMSQVLTSSPRAQYCENFA